MRRRSLARARAAARVVSPREEHGAPGRWPHHGHEEHGYTQRAWRGGRRRAGGAKGGHERAARRSHAREGRGGWA